MAPAELCSIQTYEGEKNVVGPPKTDVIDVDQLKCIATVDQFVDKLEEEEGPQAKKRKTNTKEENSRENNDQESDINTTNKEYKIPRSQPESAKESEVKPEITEKNELDDDKSKDEGYLFIYFSNSIQCDTLIFMSCTYSFMLIL